MTINDIRLGRIDRKSSECSTKKAELEDNIAVRNGTIGQLLSFKGRTRLGRISEIDIVLAQRVYLLASIGS